jgi:hypothetical protein
MSWNILPFKADFIFGNSDKSGKWGGCSISVIDFWTRNCLTAPCELVKCHGGKSNRWAKFKAFFYAQLHVTASVFPYNKLGWPFYLVEWIQSEQYPWYRRNDEHFLHSWFQHACFLKSWGCRLFPLQTLRLLSRSYWKHHVSSAMIIFERKFTKFNVDSLI